MTQSTLIETSPSALPRQKGVMPSRAAQVTAPGRRRGQEEPPRDAPYLNTRAKARPVEPQSMHSMAKDTRERDGGSGRPGPSQAVVLNRLTTKETFEDERAVEGILESASGFSTESEDALPRFQDVMVDGEPSDSSDVDIDDAPRWRPSDVSPNGSVSGSEVETDDEGDERLERMANARLVRSRE